MATTIDFGPILNDSPIFLKNYITYIKTETDVKADAYSFKKRAKAIKTFLSAYAKSKGLESSKELSVSDLESLPISFIQSYLFEKEYRGASLATKDYILYAIWGFWNYLTIDTYSIEKEKPLFYRNAFNEWKVGYKDFYNSIRNRSSEKDITIISKEKMIEILNYLEHNYVLTLNSIKQIEHWNKEKERNLAILALFFSTGITLEEAYHLNLQDINLKEKWLRVKKDGKTRKINIDKAFIPFIVPFLNKRRSWWSADRSQISLFLTQNKKRPSSSMYSLVLTKLGKGYGKKLNPYSIRISHGVNLLREGGSVDYLQEQHGIKSMAGVQMYLKHQ